MPSLSNVIIAASEAMSIKYNTMVYELRQQGKNVLVMSLGEAYFDIPLYPMDDLEAMEFLLDKIKSTKNNAEFFDAMRRG